MAEDNINSIILLDAIDKEFKTVSGYIDKLIVTINSVPQIKSLIENANGPRDLAGATDKLAASQTNLAAGQQAVITGQGKLIQLQQTYDGTIKSLNANLESNIKKLNDSKASLKDIADVQKKLTKEVEAGSIGADEYRLKFTKLSDTALKYKQRISDLNAELKDQIKLQTAVPGTIKEARVQNSQLTRTRDNTQDVSQIAALNAAIDRNNQLIDKNSDSLAKQKINIGNYQGAANTIVDALGKQEAKLQSLGSAYTSFGSQISTQRNIISGFKGDVNSTDYKKATAELVMLEAEYKRTGIEVGKTRTVIEGFRRAADISAQQTPQLTAATAKAGAAYGATATSLNGYVQVLRGSRGPTKLLGEALGIGATQADNLRLVIEHSLQGITQYFISKKAAALATEEAAAALALEAEAATVNIGITEAQITAQTNLAAAQGATAITAQAEVAAQAELDALMATGVASTEAAVVAQANLASASVATALAMQAEDVAATELIAAYSADAAASTAAAAATTALATSEVAATAATTGLSTALKLTGVGVLLAGVGLLIYAIVGLIHRMKEAAEMAKVITDVYEEASKSGGKQIADLQIQKAAIENVNIPMATRLQLIKDLKKEYPEQLKNISDENLLNGKSAEVYDLVTAAIIRKSLALAATAEIEKLSGDKLKIQLDQMLKAEEANEKIRNTRTKNLGGGSSGSSMTGGGMAGTETIITKKEQDKRIKDEYDVKDKAAKAEVDLIDKKIKTIFKLTQNGIVETTKLETDKGGGKDGSLSALKASKDTAFEQDKIRLERQLRLLDADIKDDKTYYLDKLSLLDDYTKKEKELLELEAANDIRLHNEETAREVANLKDSKKGKSGSQKDRIDQNIAIVEKNNASQIELINVKLVDDLLKNDERRVAGVREIVKNQLKIEQEFAKDRADLEEQTNDLILKLRKKQLAEEERLAKEKAAKEKQLAQDINDAKKQLAQEAFDTAGALIIAGFDRETQALDSRKRILDEDTQKKIRNINLLGLTEVERTRQIAIVEKEAAFQTEQIETRKRKVATERARFEKAQSIAAIIQSTAQAVMGALAQARELGPGAIILAGLYAGIGALQLTKAIATPIPKYKTGRGKGKDELAITGDGGVHEYIMKGDGSVLQTPAKPTLTSLAASDMVYKDKNALLNALVGSSNKQLNLVNEPNKPSRHTENMDLKKILRQLEKNGQPNISIHNNTPIESTAYYQNSIKN